MSDWTPELKAEVVADYTAESPTPENTLDIVNELAEKFEKTPNGIRRILCQEDVYVAKAAAKTAAKGKTAGPARVSKADAINELNAVIADAGLDPDDEITGKLTGKAAVYFATVIKSLTGEED